MIIHFISVCFILAIITYIASIYIIYNKNNVKSISMKKYLPHNLPIITLTNNNKALNFIIDTGSNISIISSCYINDIKINKVNNSNNNTVGIGGSSTSCKECIIAFKDTLSRDYLHNFVISDDICNTFNSIESITGIQIHGIIGVDFLRKYRYTIDFETLEVYTK